jgi:hypothetical protein
MAEPGLLGESKPAPKTIGSVYPGCSDYFELDG